MEAERARRTRARNPLSDCTNTAKSSQSSSVSEASELPHLRKSRKSVLSSAAINTLVSSADRKPAAPASGSDRAGTGVVDRARPPVVATPTRPLPRPASASGKENDEGVEPCSVYRRRESAEKCKSVLKPRENLSRVAVTSDKRKGKEKAVDEPLSCPPPTKIRKIGVSMKDDEANKRPKACTALPKKKKSVKYSDKLSQDYIEQQRAYFAEIDAFELSEEEVDGFDSD